MVMFHGGDWATSTCATFRTLVQARLRWQLKSETQQTLSYALKAFARAYSG